MPSKKLRFNATKMSQCVLGFALLAARADAQKPQADTPAKVDLFQIETSTNDPGVLEQYIDLYHLDVNKRFPNGNTPLNQALEGNHEDIVELLLAKGANVNAASANGNTPVILASAYCHKDILELLISKGVNINQRQQAGDTPLIEAAARGNEEVVRFLIAKGVDVNAKQDDGKTALDLVSENLAGASANPLDKSSPLGNRYQNVKLLLLQHGAVGTTIVNQSLTRSQTLFLGILLSITAIGGILFYRRRNGTTPNDEKGSGVQVTQTVKPKLNFTVDSGQVAGFTLDKRTSVSGGGGGSITGTYIAPISISTTHITTSRFFLISESGTEKQYFANCQLSLRDGHKVKILAIDTSVIAIDNYSTMIRLSTPNQAGKFAGIAPTRMRGGWIGVLLAFLIFCGVWLFSIATQHDPHGKVYIPIIAIAVLPWLFIKVYNTVIDNGWNARVQALKLEIDNAIATHLSDLA
jgi:hypothetical protein